MPVTVSKPAFNLREALNSLRRKMGIKGAELLRASNVDDVYSAIGTNKNVLINGSMDIWQRGVSWSNDENDGYFADRWHIQRYAANGMQISRQPVGATAPFNYCLRLGRVSGNSAETTYYLNQPVESVNSKRLAGKHATFSFYIRAGSSFKPGFYFKCGVIWHQNGSYPNDGMYYQNFRNVGGHAVSELDLSQITLSTSNWTRVQTTVYIPADVVQVGVYIGSAGVGTASNSNDYFEVTGLQLEEGAVATPFEYRQIPEELALCQRYFEKSYDQATVPGSVVFSALRTSIQATSQYASVGGLFAVTKRASPTMVAYNPATGASGQMVADATNITSVGVLANQSSFQIYCNNQNTSVNQFLNCHFTASAEL
jgi:hypothetical protein